MSRQHRRNDVIVLHSVKLTFPLNIRCWIIRWTKNCIFKI